MRMMKYTSLLETEWYKYFTRNELSAESLLGLPFLFCENKNLKLTFCPHRVRYKNNEVLIYQAECEICLNYPFDHVERFVSYHRMNTDPICNIKIERLTGEGKAAIQELYAIFDKILEHCVPFQDELVSEIDLYHEKLREVIKELDLQRVYQEICI